MNRIPRITILLSFAALVIYIWPEVTGFLQYDRIAIAHGQLWRVFSAHLTHWTPNQLFWDGVVFAILGAICERRDRRNFVFCIVLGAALISGAVFVFAPEMRFYRGLSGIDSGLFALLAMGLLSERIGQRAWAGAIGIVLVIAGFLIKIGYEQWMGETVFVSHQEGMTPMPMAHLAGAMCGFFVIKNYFVILCGRN